MPDKLGPVSCFASEKAVALGPSVLLVLVVSVVIGNFEEF